MFTALSGLLSALAAGVFLALGAKARSALLPHLVSFATGTLLAALSAELDRDRASA